LQTLDLSQALAQYLAVSWRRTVAVVLDTSSSVPDRRLAVWQDIVCDTFVGLDCRSDLHDAFWGSVSQSAVGPATFTRVESCAQRVFRTPSRIARASEDFVLVALGNSGVNGVYQDGREAVISAGQFTIYDTTRPYELRFDDSFSQTILQMPRKFLQQRIGSFDALTATTFSSDRPLERLAYEFLLGISKTIDHVDPVTATRLLDQALDLVAMAFADRMQQRSPDQSSHRSALLYRLKNYILTHLRDPELCIDQISAALGCTKRYLHMLFSDRGTTVGDYIWHARLQNCRHELETHAGKTVTDVAFSWGFSSSSHFSRVFRKYFGIVPSSIHKAQHSSLSPDVF
jgi:AraC-like DNA-binding protein